MLNWILEHLGIVIFLVIFLSQIARAVLRARKAAAEHEGTHDESAEARRMREVQEQIRRQILQRRGGGAPAKAAPLHERTEAPVARPQTTQMPQPFGGPLGRMLEELQRRAQPPSAPPPPVLSHDRQVAEVERQQQLADDLKSAEDARATVKRRAAHLAADRKAESESEPALRSVARDQLLHDLGDPQALRRAFVAREVLGTPVGLR